MPLLVGPLILTERNSCPCALTRGPVNFSWTSMHFPFGYSLNLEGSRSLPSNMKSACVSRNVSLTHVLLQQQHTNIRPTDIVGGRLNVIHPALVLEGGLTAPQWSRWPHSAMPASSGGISGLGPAFQYTHSPPVLFLIGLAGWSVGTMCSCGLPNTGSSKLWQPGGLLSEQTAGSQYRGGGRDRLDNRGSTFGQRASSLSLPVAPPAAVMAA
mmetsp:Transcript_38933/g.76567  ORF Transcript_38933/g.76567 Transcript_38933/m.76567 type:complete len:212 (-) Transcript_38933:252-887(-)